jgi:crotonobetaine/carnitine-CoA ligase
VALIGVPSDLGEDELKLVVRVREDARTTPAELIDWCRDRLPYFQVPRYIEFVDAFPKTPTQRIQKKELSRDVAGIFDLETTRHPTPSRPRPQAAPRSKEKP